MAKTRFNPQARRRARALTLQALYQWELSQNDPETIAQQFLKDEQNTRADLPYFTALFNGVMQHLSTLDTLLQPHLDRPLNALNPIERAIIRIGLYEIRYCPDLPFKVAINEALELAKAFGATEGHKYVNGVLDKVARELN